MSFNGSGTFLINTAGQPVVSGTVISSTAFNALTADLATGLSTAITKDGQTTVTANIPMSTYKFTGLGVGSAATDSANLSQVQSTVTKLLNSVSGADTITATASPTLAAYAAGQMFYFVAAGDNTTSVTLNIDALGAKAVTRDGSTALVAADIKSGEVIVVVYDGTRFQVVSQLNSAGDARFANVSIASSLNVGGVATFSAGSAAAPSITTTGDTNTGLFFPAADTIAFTEGGVESMRIDSSANVGIGTTSPADKLSVLTSQGLNTFANPIVSYGASTGWAAGFANIYDASYVDQFMLLNARMTGGTRAAPTFNANSPANGGIALKVDGLDGGLAIQTIPNGTAQSATTRLYLNPSGNLGLGVTPSAWNAFWTNLQVHYASFGGSYALPNFAVMASNTFSDGATYNNGKYIANGSANYYQQLNGVHSWHTAPSGTAGNAISFTQAMTLDASGNLGIGVTPSAWGSSARALQISGFSSVGQQDTGSFIAGFNFYQSATGFRYLSTNPVALYSARTDGSHAFFTAPSGTAGNAISFTQAMTLTAGGNLLVGTTTDPGYGSGYTAFVLNNSSVPIIDLQVGGTRTLSLLATSTNPIIKTVTNVPLLFGTNDAERGRFTSDGLFQLNQSSDTNYLFSNAAAASKGGVLANASTASYAAVQGVHSSNSATGYCAYFNNSGSATGLYISNTAAWQSTSDERLKTDIKDLDSTEKLMQLRPRDYLWKSQETSDTPDKRNFGFIAQEVQEVFPDLVGVSPDGMFSVEYTGLIAPLVKAVQELKAELDAAKVKIAALESK